MNAIPVAQVVAAVLGTLAPEPTAQAVVLPPAPVHVNRTAELSVTIVDPGFATGFPIELRLRATGWTLNDNRFDERDVVDIHAAQPRLRARVMAPPDPGAYEVVGRLRYVSCSRRLCRTNTLEVSWQLTVTQAPSEPTK